MYNAIANIVVDDNRSGRMAARLPTHGSVSARVFQARRWRGGQPKRALSGFATSSSRPKTERPPSDGDASRSMAMNASSAGPFAVRSNCRAWSSRRFSASITKEAATDMFSLQQPRHIPTLPFATDRPHSVFPIRPGADLRRCRNAGETKLKGCVRLSQLPTVWHVTLATGAPQ
jgi:hypothetical protein